MKKILAFLAVVFILLSIYIAIQPSKYDVQRSKTMKVPVSVAFNSINEFKTWKEWGPWYKEDSTIVATYSDKTTGVGDAYTWTSEKDGNGGIKTIALEENKSIDQTMYFDKRGDSEVYWRFKENESDTEVTWGMKGKLGFMGKAYFTVMGGADKVFGKMLEEGLANIDAYTQKVINTYSITKKGVVEHNGGYYIHLTTECSFDEMGAKLDKMLPEVLIYSMKKGYSRAGDIFTLYHKYDKKNKRVEFSSCIPVKERVKPEGAIALAFMEAGRYYKIQLKGAYKYSDEAWKKAFEFAKEDGYSIPEDGKPFEVYKKGHTDSANPADWITEIYLPVE